MSEARHTRGVAATLALALTLAACAKHSVSTPLKAAPHWPAVRIVGPLPTDSAPAGTIRGIVVDDSTRDGIPGVAVSIVGRARDGRSIGAVSDRTGRFQFTFAPADSFILQAGRIAYYRLALPVRLDPSRGYAFVLALVRRPPFVSCAPRNITVVVRDILSGRAPANGATVQLFAPGYRDSVTAQPGPDDSALVVRVGRQEAFPTYSVVVQSPGFRTWHADLPGAATRNPCLGPWSSPLHVWLMPR